MSSIFNHIFIPLTILLIFSEKLTGRKLKFKKIMILSFFGILPDADIFLFHRATFHNLFILIIPVLIFIFIKDIEISGITSFYLISHLVLDIFNGGIFVLYPIYDDVIFSRIELWFNDGDITSILDYGISTDITNTIGEPMISSENIGVVILLIMFVLLLIVRNIYRKEPKI